MASRSEVIGLGSWSKSNEDATHVRVGETLINSVANSSHGTASCGAEGR